MSAIATGSPAATTSGTSQTRYWGEKTFVNARKPATAAANASGRRARRSRDRAYSTHTAAAASASSTSIAVATASGTEPLRFRPATPVVSTTWAS